MRPRWRIQYSRNSDGTIFLSLGSARQLAELYGADQLVREYDVLEMELATGILNDGGELRDISEE